MDDLKSIRKRAEAIGLPFYTWAKLSSEPGSKLHQPQISNWLNGTPPSAVKVARLMKVLEQVEDLVATAKVRPDLSDETNVRLALQTLAEIRSNPATATAPWNRGAVASFEADGDATSGASEILAGATSE